MISLNRALHTEPMHSDLHSDLHSGPIRDGRRGPRVVVAPHAGDEVPGCGGMIAKHCELTSVVTLAAPDGLRRGQLRTARRMLGDPESIELGLPDGRLAGDLDQLVGELVEVVDRIGPTELYLPYPWLHHDHLVAYEAGLRAARSPAVQRDQAVAVLVYGVGTDPADYPGDISWGVTEQLCEEDVDRKVAAAKAYRSSGAHRLKDAAQVCVGAGTVIWAEQFARVGSVRRTSQPTRGLAGVRP